MEMEQTYIGNSICCDGLPDTLSTNYNSNKKPWLVAHKVDDDGMVNFYTMDEQPSKYRCRIPELGGMHIKGFCHGWMILSNPHNVMWSLWNPVTSKLIRLPPLEEGLDMNIENCCLSSPPGDPSSILLLTRKEKPNFVFCRLDRRSSKRKRSRSRWTEMSYAKQFKRVMADAEFFEESDMNLYDLTCCNGKVYALSHGTLSVVLIDIKVVKDKQVVISILPFQNYPLPCFQNLPDFYVLKGSGTELFIITVRLDEPVGIYLFKLDMTTTHDDDTTWEEIHDLKDAVFFVELGNRQPVSYIPAVALGLGGYVHLRDTKIIIHSFHVKDKILMLLPTPCLVKVTRVLMWEYRGLEADSNDRQVKCTDDDHKQQQEEDKEENVLALTRSSSNYTEEEEDDESPRLLNVPFHVLEMIMEHCVGIEYMNFRATCKRCHLAAPRIHWRDKTSLRKLEKYSLVSPWLMVVQVNEGMINFTDPISGDKYFMKSRLPSELSVSYDALTSISCSKYGWWLFYSRSSDLFGYHHLVFLNPFTNDVRKLPPTPPHYLENLCFSAPPTSNNCIVVGFLIDGDAAYILRYHVVDHEEQLLWRRFDIVDYSRFDAEDHSAFSFPTFHGRDLYALCNEGQLVVFKDMSEGSFSQPEIVVAAELPLRPNLNPPQFFLMKRGQYLLLVIWGKFGGDPKLFQFTDSTKKWTQIHSLERDVVFIGAATCLCIEETTPKMQNKIYFPRLKDGDKLIYYSLETSKFHTFDGKLATAQEEEEEEEALIGYCSLSFPTTVHLSLNAWIEPSWSS